jgi:uncharacterized protein YraI
MYQKILHIFLAIILLGACNMPTGEQSISTSTPDVGALRTQAVATVIAGAQTAAVPTITATVLTSTPTYAKPAMLFDEDTNCRSGPGIKFELVTVIKAGQTAEPLGAQGNYWVVKSPSGGGTCWVVADFATPSGEVARLPKMTAPATYTPRPVPLAPALKSWDYSCEYALNNSQSASTITVILKWQDLSNSEIGYSVYRNSELVASLPENSITYTDAAYLNYGEAATYYVEAYNYDNAARSKEARVSCQ